LNAECNNATTTIRNAADASVLASCKTFTGVIAVATDSAPIIEISGVESLVGSFIASDNPGVTTVAATDIVTVSDTVKLSNLAVLTNITFPSWQTIDTLILNNIPAPTWVELSNTAQQVNNLYVQDTQLEGLFGISLQLAQVEVLEVTGNRFLGDAVLEVGNITQQCVVRDNFGSMSLVLPNLTHVYNMQISNTSSISLPLLESVTSGLEISGNGISNLTIPALTYIGGDFNITDNPTLSELFISELVSMQGDLNIVDNPQLADVNGLDSLGFIGGSVDMSGMFAK
jgi:hypothetical protein